MRIGEGDVVTALKHHKRWIECADARHATDGPPIRPGDEVMTLCDKTVLVVEPTPGIPAPECPACDRRWRQIDGIEQREEHSSSSLRLDDRVARDITQKSASATDRSQVALSWSSNAVGLALARFRAVSLGGSRDIVRVRRPIRSPSASPAPDVCLRCSPLVGVLVVRSVRERPRGSRTDCTSTVVTDGTTSIPIPLGSVVPLMANGMPVLRPVCARRAPGIPFASSRKAAAP